jgi:1,2-phenylacetyl-CoA epoxidase PaaB subunit
MMFMEHVSQEGKKNFVRRNSAQALWAGHRESDSEFLRPPDHGQFQDGFRKGEKGGPHVLERSSLLRKHQQQHSVSLRQLSKASRSDRHRVLLEPFRKC